ncbi:HTH-type transcriptional regulator Ptr1 [Candidatus Anstonella stagnisolia]|nr:HTH-type transcriptional regulator Ptr1 [Candidatus Anstonella stagnisolia]
MEIELDQKDKRIVQELEGNARQSSMQIARKVGLSKDAVNYRIKNMEQRGIIRGYYALLNLPNLGYCTYKLMASFQNATSKTEEEIVSYLKGRGHVGWVVSCDGVYNLMVICWLRNESAFQRFLTDFLKRYAKYLRTRETLVISENHACRKAYLFGEEQDGSPDTHYGGEAASLADETDCRIISILADNARISLKEIAGKVGLSPEAVAYRMKQLEKKNVVQAYLPSVNTRLLGYQYYNVLFRLKQFDNLGKMFLHFKRHPNIIYFVRYIGGFDVGIDLEVRSTDELRAILTNIRDTFSADIESYTSVLIYQEHKLSYFPK